MKKKLLSLLAPGFLTAWLSVTFNGLFAASFASGQVENLRTTRISALPVRTSDPTVLNCAVEGVVTGSFLNLKGFFLQEEDGDADQDTLTSEGIFVESAQEVKAGQKVRVEGTMVEGAAGRQFAAGATVTVLDGGALAPLPQASVLELPVPKPVDGVPYLKRFQGMLVRVPGRLYVVDNYKLGQFGEVSLSREPRLFNPTNSIDPNDADPAGVKSTGNSNVGAVKAALELNTRSQIALDDGSDVAFPSKIPFLRKAEAGGGETLRIGDSITEVTGILHYSHKTFRIEPTKPVAFEPSNPRTATPPSVGGNLKIAGANVLNYFTTFSKEDRGADGPEELARQKAKIVAGLMALDADIIALSELQNNGTGAGSAAHDLVFGAKGLNPTLEQAGQAPYAIVQPPLSPFGTDAIQVGILYRPAKVSPVGSSVTDKTAPTVYSRLPLAQLFVAKATGARLWVVANHFKSKGGKGAQGEDKDQGDGQGSYNAQRRLQSLGLISFVQKTLLPVHPDVLVLGDLNSYGEEDPIDLFRAAGFVDLLTARHPKTQPYSFLYDGQLGRLDHALATRGLATHLTGAVEWHVNAEEPHILDYNLDTGDRADAPKKPDDRFQPSPFRYSDHDPILLGFDLPAPAAKAAPDVVAPK